MSHSQVCVKVVGSMNWDIINQVKSHYDDWQHTPFSNYARIHPRPGGHGVNQAIAVHKASHRDPSSSSSWSNDRASFGDVQVYMIGMIGTDDDGRGQKIKNALAEQGVNVEGVKQAENTATGYAHIEVDLNGKPKIRNDPLANELLTWDVVEGELGKLPRADMILVQLEIPQDTVIKTIEYAENNGIPIIFNAAPISSQGINLYKHNRIFKVDHLILNHHCVERICRTEAQRTETSLDDGMSSVPNIHKLYAEFCDHFHQQGAKCVVITLGYRGVLASYLEPGDMNNDRGQRTFFYPARKVNQMPKDETGASDAFIGAYAVEILRQMNSQPGSGVDQRSILLDIGAAIEHGIKAGALTTDRFGSFTAIPWREDWIGANVQWLTANPFVYN